MGLLCKQMMQEGAEKSEQLIVRWKSFGENKGNKPSMGMKI